ncbi:T cell receptor alpha chain%2C partial [Scomber scombrus]
MLLHFIWMMMLTFHTGSSEDLLKPLQDVMLALEGDNVTLSCKYSGSVHYLYWYQQKSSSSPHLLIREYQGQTGLLLIPVEVVYRSRIFAGESQIVSFQSQHYILKWFQ